MLSKSVNNLTFLSKDLRPYSDTQNISGYVKMIRETESL